MDFAHGLEWINRLEAEGLLGAQESHLCRSMVREKGIPAISAVLRLGALAENIAYAHASAFCSAHYIQRDDWPGLQQAAKDRLAATRLNPSWLRSQKLAIWPSADESSYDCVCSDFLNNALYGVVAQTAGRMPIRWHLATTAEVTAFFDAISTSTQVSLPTRANASMLKELAEEGPIIELINNMLSSGAQRRASDIHIEAHAERSMVRMRIDGVMVNAMSFDRTQHDAAITRIKILSELDIAERRLPQDGRINARLSGDEYDIRVSIVPASHGESVVMRLLKQGKRLFGLRELGMRDTDVAAFEEMVRAPDGIFLVTGPTGSGKSTTLYAGLTFANDGLRKIVTVEDPIEYQIDGITQIQIESDIGLSFARALRSILRHDPDVMLVGEIRDRETAEIAIQSALTGHLVLSTLHTNSAIGSIVRLVDMGIEPYMISASVRGAIAQRLVRRVCTHCSESATEDERTAVDKLARAHNIDVKSDTSLMRSAKPGGCGHCNQTGYLDRVALYDFVAFDSRVREAMRSTTINEDTLNSAIGRSSSDGVGRSGLLRDGLHKVCSGVTTLEEVLTVARTGD